VENGVCTCTHTHTHTHTQIDTWCTHHIGCRCRRLLIQSKPSFAAVAWTAGVSEDKAKGIEPDKVGPWQICNGFGKTDGVSWWCVYIWIYVQHTHTHTHERRKQLTFSNYVSVHIFLFTYVYIQTNSGLGPLRLSIVRSASTYMIMCTCIYVLTQTQTCDRGAPDSFKVFFMYVSSEYPANRQSC
jgi:hypothetical protein